MKHITTLLLALCLLFVATPALNAADSSPSSSPPADVTSDARQGRTVTLSVTAAGTQPFTYQWEKAPLPDPEALSSPGFTPIAGAISASLVLPNVTPADAGIYRVTIANLAGSTTSPTATLRVLIPPTVEAFTISVSGE